MKRRGTSCRRLRTGVSYFTTVVLRSQWTLKLHTDYFLPTSCKVEWRWAYVKRVYPNSTRVTEDLDGRVDWRRVCVTTDFAEDAWTKSASVVATEFERLIEAWRMTLRTERAGDQ